MTDTPAAALKNAISIEYGVDYIEDDKINAILHRLAGAGWRVVPAEMTEAMEDELCPSAFDTAQECWAAVLAAAPGGPND